jgi:hypothetical protein
VTGGTSTLAPAEATCGRTSAVHVPAPPPASETVTEIDWLFAPPPATRYPNESDCGSVKISGLSADETLTSPAPWTMTEASCDSVVSAKDGPAVDISADLTCCGVQDGWRCVRSAATPDTCGAEKLVPSRTANLSPANSSSVDERICAPGAITSGFSA